MDVRIGRTLDTPEGTKARDGLRSQSVTSRWGDRPKHRSDSYIKNEIIHLMGHEMGEWEWYVQNSPRSKSPSPEQIKVLLRDDE